MLVCSPTALIKDQRAADAACGDGATCQPLQGTGVCTYDDYGYCTSGIPIIGSLTVQSASINGPRPVIDCESKGRAFHYMSTASSDPNPDDAATFRLSGVEVRNGDVQGVDNLNFGGCISAEGGTLELDKCVFMDCVAKSGGSVGSTNALVRATATSFGNTINPRDDDDNFMGARAIGKPNVDDDSGDDDDGPFDFPSRGSVRMEADADFVDAVAFLFDGCNFTATAASEGGGISAILYDSGSWTNTNARILNSRFTGTSAYSDRQSSTGGGVSFDLFGTLDGAALEVDACAFHHTVAWSDGGGIHMAHGAESISNASLSVRNSEFVDNYCYDRGCAVFLGYQPQNSNPDGIATSVVNNVFDSVNTRSLWVYHNTAPVNPVTLVQGNTFRNADFAGESCCLFFLGGASGAVTTFDANDVADSGQLNIQYGESGKGEISHVVTTISSSTFRNTTPGYYPGGSYYDGSGGGASIDFGAETASTTTSVTGSSFIGCAAAKGAPGGGLAISFEGPTTASATVTIDGVHFENNTATGINGQGGGMIVGVTGDTKVDGVGFAGFSFDTRRSAFVGNRASDVEGGGAIFINLPRDEPQNLRFTGDSDPALWRNQSSGAGQNGDTGNPDDDEFNPVYPIPREFAPAAAAYASA